jgi:tRNA threonylcarbamoyladenosine biosynthesis protein TsaB
MLLLIDTAFDLCQVGLWDDNQLIARISAPGEARHDVILAPLVDRLLQKNNTKIADLSGIAVMTGPGRFTSLRVGIAFARALILPHPLSLYGVTTSAVLLAHSQTIHATWQKPAVLMAVKRGEIFVQTNKDSDPLSLLLADLPARLDGCDGVIAIGAGIPSDWQDALPETLPRTILTHLPLEAIGVSATALATASSGHHVVRPFYGTSTGAGT